MKTFKSAAWDSDANTSTFQELFQKSKKIKNTIDKSRKEVKKNAKALEKRIKKKLNKKNAAVTDTKNLISTPEELMTQSKKRRLRKMRAKLKKDDSNNSQTDLSSLVSVKKTKPKKIKSKPVNEEIKLVLATPEENQENPQPKKKKKKPKKIKTEIENEPKKPTKTFKKSLNKLVFSDHSFTEKLLDTPEDAHKSNKKEKFYNKLKVALNSTKKSKPMATLRQKMIEKLKSARFRFINEQIYSTDSKEAKKLFEEDPEAFKSYHEGYRNQVKSWPVNPLDLIIEKIKKLPKTNVIADFGCGDARLSKSVVQKVHSFDLVATDDSVVACDMSKVPLENNSVDVAVFCLSLMGTNLRDYLFEANRVLKIGGVLKIAEVESRFEDVEQFIKGVQHFGFKSMWKDLSHNLFYFLDFKKEKDVRNKNKLPTLSLLPCLYKKR
ncbi:unnamed protein product [Phyllotreta striolata]|uniref:Ribosomal RNA-processing protein 8 n=1 Tax=Phyllotreta striolata TaxID=444603 RepID=A0A9N9XM46_PHYSR|nr:unnamed protein product [Phyllotreta striolata]